MSSYITRYCLHHGEWEMDVDNPGDCEQCIKEGIDPPSKARGRIAALESALREADIKLSAYRDALETVQLYSKDERSVKVAEHALSCFLATAENEVGK